MSPATAGSGGLIGTFTRHPTAANLLMALMIVAGLFAMERLNRQFFPTVGLDVITVSVVWTGASAEDVDSNIIEALEPELRFLAGVDSVTATAREGLATITIEFAVGTDMQRALSDVETAVAGVTTLPDEAERPKVSPFTRYDPVVTLLLSGPYPESTLKAVAKRIRDDLLDRGVDRVGLFGVRDEEIHVEVPPENLRRFDLSLTEIAARIGETAQDVPSGESAGAAVRQVRSLAEMETARDVRDVVVRTFADGTTLRLEQVADVREAFDESGSEARVAGVAAVELSVERSETADSLEIADTVDAYLAEEVPKILPPGMELRQFQKMSDLIRSRIDLLVSNGMGGLVVVLLVLFLFLNFRVAFWVAMGIPTAMLAALVLMLVTGQTINMISLFALIMVLGIIVDDAIVVGEHAEHRRALGLSPEDAAESGAARMLPPVTASSLTTVCTFAPLLMIGGTIGQVIEAIPLVAMVVIIASLIECFLVLPGHMRGALAASGGPPGAFRRWFDGGFDRIRSGWFRRLVAAALDWRYATVMAALAAFAIALGLLMFGRLDFRFFVAPEATRIYGNLEMVAGTPRDRTRDALAEMERALRAVDDVLRRTEGGSIVAATITRLPDDTSGTVAVELTDSDTRQTRTGDFVSLWQAEIRPLPGVRNIVLNQAMGGPPGKDVDVRLAGESPASLKAAAEDVKALLDRYPGVRNIDDDLPWGKEEMILEVSAQGRALGFTTEGLGRQVRALLDGAIARRFPRGDEEVTIRVRAPRAAISDGGLATLFVQAPNRSFVPLSEVADIRYERGFSTIQRRDGERRVAVTAEIFGGQTTTQEVVRRLRADGLADIEARHGVTATFGGRAEEQAETFADMRTGGLLALIGMYIVLAWVFGSYLKPVVVMSIIPLAFVGTVLGHLLMGYDMSVLSLVALIGLSGIVVNDSIILVSTIKERFDAGEDTRLAIIDGTCERLRAVLLTSLTTIGGLTPLLFETSLQARFLIPMALTIVFGLMVTTVMVLVVVPAMMGIVNDIRSLGGYRERRDPGAAEAAEASGAQPTLGSTVGAAQPAE